MNDAEINDAKTKLELAIEKSVTGLLNEFVYRTGATLKAVHFNVLSAKDERFPPYIAMVEVET